MDISLAAFLDALHLLEREESVVDGGVQSSIGRGRAADGTAGGRQGWRRGEVDVVAQEASVQRHQGRGTLLHNDGGLHVVGLGRSNGSHVHRSSAEGIGGSHLVHVQHGLLVERLLSSPVAVLRLSKPWHIGGLAGVRTLLL